jgi:heme oxygenase (mycobilin-producing)
MPDETYHDPASGGTAVTLINVVEIPADQIYQFMVGWKQRADIMSTLPGFRDYALHRALLPESRFQLVNVAHWDSREAFEAAMTNPEFHSLRTVVQGEFDVTGTPALYQVIASDRRHEQID